MIKRYINSSSTYLSVIGHWTHYVSLSLFDGPNKERDFVTIRQKSTRLNRLKTSPCLMSQQRHKKMLILSECWLYVDVMLIICRFNDSNLTVERCIKSKCLCNGDASRVSSFRRIFDNVRVFVQENLWQCPHSHLLLIL